jgi:hypothetical protein
MPKLRADARTALERAEQHYENVLRPIVPPFVRAVLDRSAPADDVEPGRPVAYLAAGETLGDHATAELLESCGYAVRRGPVADASGAAVVVVTRTVDRATSEALRTIDVPVIAWGGQVELGLASSSVAAMLWTPLEIVDPDDPLAAGYTGTIDAYRGPNYVIVAHPGPAARVVARGPEGGAAVFRYAAGDLLADRSPAPAARIGLFLGREGPAPWLLNPVGRALVTAALDLARAG